VSRRFRAISRRATLTTVDQCVSSASNFAVGVAVARIAGVAGLGTFTLAYAAWLEVASMHRALITDPMAIEGDVRHPDATANLRVGFSAEMCLGVAGGVASALVGALLITLGHHSFGIAFLALAPWLPFLLIQDYWRWVGFMQAIPSRSLANDVVFDGVQIVAFLAVFISGARSPAMLIAAWGLGSAVAAAFGLWQFSVRPTVRGGVTRLRSRWHMSKWLTAAGLTSQGANQSYLVLAGAMLGPVAIGGLKAAQSLVSGPSMVLVQAGGSFGLPEASRGLADHGWAGLRRVARLLTAFGLASVGCIGIVVLAFGKTLLKLFYGPAFTRFSTSANLIALGYVLSACALGAIMSLKATKQSRVLFRIAFLQLIVSTVAVIVLAPAFGVVGVAASTVVGSLIILAVTVMADRRSARPVATRRLPVSADPIRLVDVSSVTHDDSCRGGESGTTPPA
jgi:O-antigen/teichoic acid export membrane protein